jgi:nucleoside-diphosphate-sugar epimerase
MSKLSKSIAIITGGAQGLGKATADRLQRGGAKVWVLTDLENIVGKEPLREINKMTPNSQVSALRKISEQMPNGPEFAHLQRHILNLMSEQRSSLDFAVCCTKCIRCGDFGYYSSEFEQNW